MGLWTPWKGCTSHFLRGCCPSLACARDNEAASHMVPSPSSGLLPPPPKLPTLGHTGGDFGNQAQASGTSGVMTRPIRSRGQAWALLFCSRPQAEAASLSPFESHKDGVASSSLCPWRPYCSQEEEAWQVHESSKMRFLEVILLFHLQ